jgi:hypothetical protein
MRATRTSSGNPSTAAADCERIRGDASSRQFTDAQFLAVDGALSCRDVRGGYAVARATDPQILRGPTTLRGIRHVLIPLVPSELSGIALDSTPHQPRTARMIRE